MWLAGCVCVCVRFKHKMPNRKRVQAKPLSPVTAHLLEVALPALANSWYAESMGAKLKDANVGEYPRWMHELVCVAHDDDEGGVHYPMDEDLLAEWIRTDHRKACFVLNDLFALGIRIHDHFDTLDEDDWRPRNLVAHIEKEVLEVYEANVYYDHEEVFGGARG